MKAVKHSTSGTVLIMTLAAMAVMMILLLALFQGVSHQIRGAQGDASLARETMLADSAVELVIGQVEQASAQTNQAWISQPGLLRTYSTNAVRAPTACYKLYSTASLTNMIDTSGNLAFLSNDIPANWNSTPSQYTDLNSPVTPPGLFAQPIYPILNPAALTNVASPGEGIEGVSSDMGGDASAVTMPVAWLYELQDGTLGPASNGTAANPIVARIAFWTDDDTCKININTAGYGVPWNTPRVNSSDDVAWSTNQPAAGVFYSYPGHPATTSLATIFGTNSFSGTNVLSPQQLLGLSPRYAWNGAPARMDRLYASLDELCFSTNMVGTPLQREANPVGAAQLDTARFVLTAHSVAPETTLLGEPRIAIWPVADSTSTGAPRMTATDNAITNDATLGVGTAHARSYFFQRNNPLSKNDDFNPDITTSGPNQSNVQLFNDLVARGQVALPGYGSNFDQKYAGAAYTPGTASANWTQIVLEIVDFIHGLNSVDSDAAITPFAGGDSTGAGRAFVEPLMWTYGAGTPNQVVLRGLGRCPTLSSLTLVFYVCGFGFKNGTHVDFEETPDIGGTNWAAEFTGPAATTNWPNVTSERIRTFVVPNTFQPGCGYPEVSETCSIQIQGLTNITMSNGVGAGSNAGNCGFTNSPTSHLLSDALKVSPADRAWGGNEGPLAWRAAALDAQQTNAFFYAFSGTNSMPVTFASSPSYNSATGVVNWPTQKFKFSSLSISSANLTVLIQDAQGNTLQTLQVNLPTGSAFAVPTSPYEYTEDGSGNTVAPSYYMTLRNRVLATGTNRLFMIQPGDVSRSFEAGTDLRVIAGMSSVPTNMFPTPSSYKNARVGNAHNLHFADGTAVFGANGSTTLDGAAGFATNSTTLTWNDWSSGSTTNYAWSTSPPNSCPTTASFNNQGVRMTPGPGYVGDWDTGPGVAPDGALINLPDAGTTNAPAAAYFSLTKGCLGAPAQRTPNALVASPVVFGSLPAGINATNAAQSVPWRTLLFCPYPAANTSSTPYTIHPGAATSPPDHLILDNFWMPVVEPYPISTCLATAGKINLNDQIAPFTYLHRNTALRALLDGLRIPAIPATTAATYKSPGTPSTSVFWNPVDENATVAQIENKFANSSTDAYLSESEICAVPLVPQGVVPAGTSVAGAQSLLDTFWNGLSSPAGGLTGDNLRELPYAQLYSRLTTRSNSYTVHVRVQVLKKLPNDPHQGVWNEGVDVVLADWRGSYEIERYLDPTVAAPTAGQPLGVYKFRILSARRFAP